MDVFWTLVAIVGVIMFVVMLVAGMKDMARASSNSGSSGKAAEHFSQIIIGLIIVAIFWWLIS